MIIVGPPQSHQNHSSSRGSTESQQQSQVSAAEIMSAAGLAAMAAAELGTNSICLHSIVKLIAFYDFSYWLNWPR